MRNRWGDHVELAELFLTPEEIVRRLLPENTPEVVGFEWDFVEDRLRIAVRGHGLCITADEAMLVRSSVELVAEDLELGKRVLVHWDAALEAGDRACLDILMKHHFWRLRAAGRLVPSEDGTHWVPKEKERVDEAG